MKFPQGLKKQKINKFKRNTTSSQTGHSLVKF